MKHLTCLILLVLTLAVCSSPTFAGNVTGKFSTPNTSIPLAGATVSFALTQVGVVSGTFALVGSPVQCYTSTDGTVVSLPNPSVAPMLAAAAGTLAAGTYYVRITYYVGSTETLPSPAGSIVLGGAGGIQVSAPVLQPAGATGYKVYIGTLNTNETQQAIVSSWTSSTKSNALVSGVAKPTTNTSVCALTFNDAIIPAYTTYRVSLTDANGNIGVQGFPQEWYLSGSSVDITLMYPVAVNVRVRFPQPIIANPSSQATQSVNSPLTLNGYTMTAGNMTLPQNANPPTPSPLPSSGYSVIWTDTNNVLNLCSGTGQCWQVGQTTFSPSIENNIRKCDGFAGATEDAKLVACFTSIPSTGGTADARGLEGAQSWSACPFTGITKSITLMVGAGTHTIAVNCTVPVNIALFLQPGAILSPNVATTLTIAGSIEAPLTQVFTGAGTVVIQ